MKTKISYILIALGILCTSCSDFLNVQPSDRISEETNFTNIAGFKQAINGIYVELNSSDLYGRALTCEFIEIMAQRYAIDQQNNKSDWETMQLNYSSSTPQSRLQNIWSKGYNLIANCNLIIKNCEQHREVLPDEYYHLIKGEAYALRAYLHLDLFRLFGSVYDPEVSTLAIPYYTQLQLDVAPTPSAQEFMDLVLKDLKTAEEELQDDPIVTFGVNGNPKDIFLQFRNLRLNLYAVYGLLARYYYYAHDNENAYAYAKKVVDIQERHFPWVKLLSLTGSNIDHMFSTEIMFALQNLQRDNLFTSLFNGNSLKTSSLLAPFEDVTTEIFGGTMASSDYRVRSSLSGTVEQGGKKYVLFNKYQGTDSLYNQMIPMIRVSESFLILAETGPDDEERLSRFTEFNNARGLQGVENIEELNTLFDDIDNSQYTELGKEWIREFYGEGQLFFWYKRNQCLSMRSATSATNDLPFRMLSASRYTPPIPEGEEKYN